MMGDMTVTFPGGTPFREQRWGNEPNAELSPELAEVKARQERYPRRELARVADCFEHYEHELRARKDRERREKSIARYQQRIEATHAEHRRCRGDQIERHAMRGIPHLDALLVSAEPAFCTVVESRGTRGQKCGRAIPAARQALVLRYGGVICVRQCPK